MKSGTTLMRALIGNHSNIYGGLETWWFSEAFQAEYPHVESKTGNKLTLLYDIPQKDYEKLVNESEGVLDFLNRFLLHGASQVGKSRWVEKTPDNIFHLKPLIDHFGDEFLFIYMLRNPLDTYASWKSRTKHNLDFFLEKMTATMSVLTSEVFTSLPHTRFVRYEDLVMAPQATMQSVISWVGEDWEEGIEQNQTDRSEYEKVKQLTNKHSGTLESLSKPIFQSSVGQYEEILEEAEVKQIETQCAAYMNWWRQCSPDGKMELGR